MAGPIGLGPSQIQSAYKLAGLRSGGRTVAIVDAFDDPKAESDLATFRKTYGLSACTTANGCFKKINENGAASPLPTGDYGWAEEISLDLDAVSSACPDCHILLVEASSANSPDLDKAEDTAAASPGVVSISNSYGGSEASSQLSDDSPLQPSRRRDHGELGRLGVRRQLARLVAVRDRCRRHDAQHREQRARLERDRVVGRRERLLGVRAQAELAARCRLREADGRRRLRRRGSEHRPRRVRHVQQLRVEQLLRLPDRARRRPGTRRMGAGRRDEPQLAADRLGVRARRQHRVDHVRELSVQPHGLAVRRDQRIERQLRRLYLCTAGAGYDGPTGLGTPNGIGGF